MNYFLNIELIETLYEQICPPLHVSIKPLQRGILLNMVGEYLKKANTLAGNAANISLGGKLWLSTNGEYMKETKMLQDTKGLFIKANKY